MRFKDKLTKTKSMKEPESQIMNDKPLSSRNNQYMYLNDINSSQLVPETGGDVVPKADRMYSSHQRNKTMNTLNSHVPGEYNHNQYLYTSSEQQQQQFLSTDNLGLFKLPTYNDYVNSKTKFNKTKGRILISSDNHAIVIKNLPIGAATSKNRYSSKGVKTSRQNSKLTLLLI